MTPLTSLARRGWDMIVIGGGITGAGILREAARLGLKALLVERRDFAAGTSSHSSKLIHGGLRYFVQGQIRMMWESVQARQHLLRDGPPLVSSIGYVHTIYQGDRITPFIFETGIRAYALLHGHLKVHRRMDPSAIGLYVPGFSQKGLRAIFTFDESQTDDARLVLRVLREATDRGAVALNYTSASGLLRDERGHVNGILAQDPEDPEPVSLQARVVVNATGAWADSLRRQIDAPAHIRPMRGSHLVIPGWRLRLGQITSFFHPENGRPVYCVPWKGVVLVGTTDVDQEMLGEGQEPHPSAEEIHFLLRGLQARFPTLDLSWRDIQAVFAGLRPVADVRTSDPTKASREHMILYESGLLTVAGGKLTTFHTMALAAFEKLREHLPQLPKSRVDSSALDPLPDLPRDLPLDSHLALDWLSRYGENSLDFLCAASPLERAHLHHEHSASLADFRWVARQEAVRHLDDLLLRRTRLGLTAPSGGAAFLPRLRPILQEELNWTDSQWDGEVARYLAYWAQTYGVPVLT
jgi:glycerol-3-phosphate dehydrogenase